MINFYLDFYFKSKIFFSQGHEKEALQLMATYLPKDTSPGSAYQEGGGLYALGLIHANHGGDIIDYLLSQLKNASNDVSVRVFFFFFNISFAHWFIVKY